MDADAESFLVLLAFVLLWLQFCAFVFGDHEYLQLRFGDDNFFQVVSTSVQAEYYQVLLLGHPSEVYCALDGCAGRPRGSGGR